MLSFLPPALRGVISTFLLVLNTLIMSLPLFAFALLKLLIPVPAIRRFMGRMANAVAELWISANSAWMKLTLDINLKVEGLEGLDRNGYYLVTANHQTWADIMIMQHLLNRRIPFMKFFLKQQLIWVPVIGLCWWALDFPFMKRYTRAYLEKHPEKRGKDLETTRKACEKFRETPVSIVNYLEGTRYTRAKHEKQQSPYNNLLKPRAGGISYVLGALGDQVKTLLNITIHYEDKTIGYWDFLCGRIKNVSVRIETQPIPQSLATGDYQNDRQFRDQFQQWVNELWEEKDRYLTGLQQGQS
ncbi:MAG: acyltransferase [Endozoicomonas sp.]